jgi:hypothetical protein
MSRDIDFQELKRKIEYALLDFQDEIGLDRGGANLWPGTSARIAMEVFIDAMYAVDKSGGA